MKTKSYLFLILCLPLNVFSQFWNPAQMIKFKRVGSAIISPDGNKVAYTVSVPLMKGEKSEYLTHIWLATTTGSMNRQFTYGEQSCSNVRFSPDNKYLSFTSSRDGKVQLYLMAIDGGEAEKITSQKSNIGSYAWSPDGKKIAFLMLDTLSAKEERDKKEKRDMEVAGKYKNAQLYTLSLRKNDEGEYPVRRLTRGNFHITDLSWSPDSKVIAFTHQENASLDIWSTSDISIIPADSGAVKLLVHNAGQDSNPIYSPDGQWIAFLSDGGKASWVGRMDIFIIPASGGESKKLASTFDQDPQLIDWSPDSKAVWVLETLKTSRVVYMLPVNGKPPSMISSDNGFLSNPSFNKNGEIMAYIYQDVSSPPQVMIQSLKDKQIKKLSSVNEDFAGIGHARTEVISWKSKDRKYEIEGLITYPENYQKNRKYPLILVIHGGPAGVFVRSYTGAGSLFPIQSLAHDGYVILRPNPRGSGGYGADFRQANHDDWGFGDYEDIMAGVDKLITENIAHPDSLCVTGWSYGGYMTSMVITKTNRFKAAMVGAGVTDLFSFTTTSDIPGFIPDYFDVEMWDRPDVYMKHSAMFNVKNVKTPTLVIHGADDLRVPLSQGQELYGALKRMSVSTEMVIYPRTQHGPQEPKFILDIAERTSDWFNTYLERKK